MKAIFRFFLLAYFSSIILFLVLPYFPTRYMPILNSLSPLTPYLLSLQLIGVVILLILKNRALILMQAVLLVFSIPILLKHYSFGKEGATTDPSGIKIVSYNASFFNVPQVFKADYFDPNYDHFAPKVREWLVEDTPDIVCLQEFFNDENSPIYNTIGFFEENGFKTATYYKARHDNGLQRGIATFSRFPIIKNDVIITSPTTRFNAIMYTDLLINSDTVRLFNVHLKSMKLGRFNVINYIKRQRNTALERDKQIETLLHVMDTTKHPMIIAGDFNETPFSYNMRRLESRLVNGHEEVGRGMGLTYHLLDKLGVRIDHILASDDLKFQSFETLVKIHYSEHKPIRSNLVLKN